MAPGRQKRGDIAQKKGDIVLWQSMLFLSSMQQRRTDHGSSLFSMR